MTIGDVEDMGISISVNQNTISLEEESSNLMSICPCLTGPFELPENYEPASPSYLIRHNIKDFQKDVTIRMHHYASLQNEEDCEDMAFFTASSTPEYRESRPVYTFKEIQGAKGIFKPGEQVGEISLSHFCFLRAAKRKRGDTPVPESSPKRHKGIRRIEKGFAEFFIKIMFFQLIVIILQDYIGVWNTKDKCLLYSVCPCIIPCT